MADQAETPEEEGLPDQEILRRLMKDPEVRANLEWIKAEMKRKDRPRRGVTKEELRHLLLDDP